MRLFPADPRSGMDDGSWHMVWLDKIEPMFFQSASKVED